MVVVLVVEAFDRRSLDPAVHPLGLAFGPRVIGSCQPLLNAVGLTDQVEAHRPRVDAVAVPRLHCELDAVACSE